MATQNANHSVFDNIISDAYLEKGHFSVSSLMIYLEATSRGVGGQRVEKI